MKNSRYSNIDVVVQTVAEDIGDIDIPAQSDFERWVDAVVAFSNSVSDEKSEVGVRIVGNEESANLNQRYRGCSAPTNVLTFPCEAALLLVDDMELKPLGDIVIAAPVVVAEARKQAKQAINHWAHLFVHGMLHLQGYDHVNEHDACRMESCEIDILNQLGFPNPYQQNIDAHSLQ